VPTRSADGVRWLLQNHRAALAAALGGDHLETRVSSSVRLDADHDRSVAHSTAGPFDVFDRVEYERVDGALVTRLVELRVERAAAPLAIVRFAPLDRVRIWVGDDRLRRWVDAVAADVALTPVDLLDPSPDLVGADLGSGRLAASDGFRHRWVQWDLVGRASDDVLVALRDALPALVAGVTGGAAPALVSSTDRQWNPMDGAVPPDCPFTETTVLRGECDDGTSVRLAVESDQWSAVDVNNVSVTLAIGERVSVAAFGSTGGGDAIRTVRLYRPTTPHVVLAVDRALVGFVVREDAASEPVD
jgi:hypothetical protein